MVDEMGPNQASDKEKAEGSRENVNIGTGADNPMERGSGQNSRPNEPAKQDQDDAGGISNRPLSEEERLDQQLPPRGQAKKGAHGS
jgi:hypothetical protein